MNVLYSHYLNVQQPLNTEIHIPKPLHVFNVLLYTHIIYSARDDALKQVNTLHSCNVFTLFKCIATI